MPESTGRTEQLADYQRRYRELAGQLAEVGFIATGTVVQRSIPLRPPRLPLPCRPAPIPRPLLAMDHEGGR